jgi:hypothetical protein
MTITYQPFRPSSSPIVEKNASKVPPFLQAERYAPNQDRFLKFAGNARLQAPEQTTENANPSLQDRLQVLERNRNDNFSRLKKHPDLELTASEKRQKDLAPMTSEVVFLVPHGEPFFDTVYPTLKKLGADKKAPTIHLGIGVSRNLSIIAATKADAAILPDLNTNTQLLIKAFSEVAAKLDSKKGAGHYGPVDFVKEFHKHPQAQDLLEKTRRKAREVNNDFHTDLAEELIVPESWLFHRQNDGRFEHVMKLFREGKIGAIPMNLVDSEGFEQLSAVLDEMKAQSPELKNAKVNTVFLSNLISHLAKSSGGYFLFENDRTPRDSVTVAFDNIRKIAPDNPYVIFAHTKAEKLLDNPHSPFFNRRLLDGPTHEQLKSKLERSPDKELIPFNPPFFHHQDWILANQPTMGGPLSHIEELLKENAALN